MNTTVSKIEAAKERALLEMLSKPFELIAEKLGNYSEKVRGWTAELCESDGTLIFEAQFNPKTSISPVVHVTTIKTGQVLVKFTQDEQNYIGFSLATDIKDRCLEMSCTPGKNPNAKATIRVADISIQQIGFEFQKCNLELTFKTAQGFEYEFFFQRQPE